MRALLLLIAAGLLTVLPLSAMELTPEMAEKGKVVYDKRCIGCHGEKGRGDGPAAERLRPKPRNFARGIYKFTYTEFGKLPQDSTLFRWVKEGLPGTTMPAWKNYLKDDEIWNVVAYIKTLSKKFARAKKKGRTPKPIDIGSPPEFNEELIKAGRVLFEKNCVKCHGEQGRGSGVSAPGLKDDWGDRIWPRNLRKGWTLRGGNAPEDIFRTVATGISGTPMPAHLSKEVLPAEDIWKVVGYVSSIMQKKAPNIKEVVVSRFAEGDVPKDPDDERWNEIEGRWYPLVSNIIEGERFFKTTLDWVVVRSMYNEKEISIYVEYADRTKSPLDKVGDKFPVNEPDALAVQLATVIPTAMEKPYFLGGDSERNVVLWRWQNGDKTNVLLGTGLSKQVLMPDENQIVTATAKYDAGLWKVVYTRSIAGPTENDLTIEVGRYIPIAFNAWDGNNGEKDERRAISIWHWLLLEPPSSMTVYLWPLFMGLLVVVGEVVLIRKANNQN